MTGTAIVAVAVLGFIGVFLLGRPGGGLTMLCSVGVRVLRYEYGFRAWIGDGK
jgi:hypothetical protein